MRRLMKLIYKLRKLYWFFTRPVTKGARALLIKEGKILLVKHTYDSYWFIPGGKVNKNETYEACLRRELKEEIRAEMNTIKLFGVYNNFFEYKDDTVVIFLIEDFTFQAKPNIEIEAIEWFDINKLPSNISKGSRKRVLEYIDNKGPYYGKW